MEQAATVRKRLDDVLEALDAERAGTTPEVLREFGRRLLVRAPAEFLERREPTWIREDVQALFGLLQETEPGEIAVRIRDLPDGHNRAVVETAMPDRAFIVNTLREALHGRGYDIHYLLHPVLVLERDEAGRIVEVRDRSSEGLRTSLVQIGIEGYLDEARSRALEEELHGRLLAVLQATGDFQAMKEASRQISEELEAKKEEIPWRATEFSEIQELLRWLEDDNFVFLGYRAYRLEEDEEGEAWIQVEPDSGLGILRQEEASRYAEPRAVRDLPPDLRARVLGGPLLIVSKANSESPVQRRERMDYVGIKRLGPGGKVRGEHRFVGLYTAQAYQQDASTIPILRRKLREILEQESATRGSHDYNLILQVFNSMPKEELFLSSVGELSQLIESVMETEGADEVRLVARPDALARGVNAMVILPKHRFSEEVRRKIEEDLVAAYRGTLLHSHLALSPERDQARLHFYLASDLGDVGAVEVEELEERVRGSVRSWEERLSDALERTHEVERAHELADRHGADFSPEYKAITDVQTAVEDIALLESLEATGVQQVVLEEADPDRPHVSRLKVFAARGRFVLSDVMPTLENLGFRVLDADRYDVAEGDRASTIHAFHVEAPKAWEVDREEAEPRVADALRAVQAGWAEDDRLNSLVLSARLDWRQAAVLRAYAGYAFRVGAVASRQGGQRPLVEHPRLARLLYEIFRALHDPAVEERMATVGRLKGEFQDRLRAVKGIEDDRTYRRLLNLIEATARTNAFRQPDGAAEASSEPPDGPFTVALKFDCPEIEVMPRPRPRFEVYVSGPRTEGAHLRMDAVARGGIRWSDRSEDFRVEVLGLVKTQQVKNAVIVPAGAKGAFILKRPPEDPGEAGDAAVESYREFIGSLLDLSDNVVGGEVRHPAGVVVRDGEDPYLVVAADKGTARLSDTANELAAERGFWLGDAFASGGSRGYDHKEMGITARGAWECVKRLFRELGTDIQNEPFAVVGIGDMSGDVFGNGMLLSRRIRLIGAFDHRHIFVDPDPDPERSWEERKRLFELPRSSWEDYDRAALSAGGDVFERGAKEIDLSPAAREALGIGEEEGEEATGANGANGAGGASGTAGEPLNGETLIRHILRAPVDLLWNGGIGTYVKASWEAHGEVGDPSNDAVRVDATELRAKVVGEGGNLGLTQPARVEFALAGGRLNTDALDNSAGVDTSDHEVNLKILLNDAVEAGWLEEEGRNELLIGATEAVADDVLANNWSQSLAVSLDERRVRETPAEFRDAMLLLERSGLLDRALEFLPTTEELLERHEEGRYLTRPELAVVLAYAKMHLKRRVLASELPDDPAFMELVRDYFPREVLEALGERPVGREGDAGAPGEDGAGGTGAPGRTGTAGRGEMDRLLRGHHLRPHIIATALTNRFVDRMGSTVHLQLVRETGKDPAEVARAWWIAGRIGRADELHAALRETDDVVPAGVQYQWFLEMSTALERTTLWLLTNADPEVPTAECIEFFREPVAEIRGALMGLLPEETRRELENRQVLYETDGLEAELAARLVSFSHLDALLPVAQLAREAELAALVAGRVYFGVSREIDFAWLQDRLARLPAADLWVQRAAKTLSLQLDGARLEVARRVLDGMDPDSDVEAALAEFRERSAADMERIRQVIEDVRDVEAPDLAPLLVAVHAIRSRWYGEGGAAG